MLLVYYIASFLLSLSLALLIQARTTVSHAHSLCLDLTVKSQSGPGHPWYEVQGSVDKEPFLQYDSDSSKVRPLGLLGEKVHATRAWTGLTQMLGDMGQELRMILPDVKLENSMTRGPPALDIQLCCQREAERCTTASWRFNINGQTALLFDAMNMTWTIMNPGARGIKEEWEDKGLAGYFRRISTGDCNHWLRKFLEHWEKVLEPPAPSVNTSDAMSSSTRETRWTVLAISIWSVCICLGIFGKQNVSSLDHDIVTTLDQPLLTKTNINDNLAANPIHDLLPQSEDFHCQEARLRAPEPPSRGLPVLSFPV